MRSRPFLIVLALFTVLYVGHIVALDVLPMIDLPYHLAAAAIYRDRDAPGNNFAEYYSVDVFPNPNISHLVFCGAEVFSSVETANKVYLCLYVVLLPLSVFLLIRKLGGDPWFTLLSFTVLYHYSFSWGFVAFTMSVPFVLFFFYGLLHHADNSSTRNKVVLALLLLLLFFMHILSALFCAVVLLLHCVTASRASFREAAKEAVVLVPLLILIVLWRTSLPDGAEVLGVGTYYRSEYLPTLYRRAAFFFWDNFALYASVKGWIVAACFSIFIVHFPLVSWAKRRPSGNPWKLNLSTEHLLLVAALLFYLILPRRIPGTAHLYERFSVLVLLALILLGSRVVSQGCPRVMRIAIVGVCLLHFGLWTDYHVAFRADASSFGREILPDGKGDGRLAALIFDADFRGRPVYNHFQDYYTVWKRGVTVSKVGDFRFYPIRKKASRTALPVYNEWIGKWGSYDGRYRDMDYLLVKGTLPEGMKEHLESFAAEEAAGDWTLYKKKETF
ncbi:MAG: hypothetical protein KAT30_00845 [Candidatus Krumholzibacteria bacterium]|nr:hypothetical protein [Candidatus Krumholzibacteria bacterium]